MATMETAAPPSPSAAPADSPARVIDGFGDAFVAVDAAQVIVEWNRHAETTFGWDRSEAVGRALVDTVVFWEGVGELRPKGLVVDDILVIGQGRQVWARHRDGHAFPAELTVWCSDPAASSARRHFAVVRDLTEQRRIEAERARLAAIVECSEDAIIGLDGGGLIATWNKGAEHLFGYALAEVVDQPVTSLAAPDHAGQLADWERQAAGGTAVRNRDLGGVRANGLPLELSVTLSPVYDGNGHLTGTSLVARDVTEQRWTARTLDATLATLETALRDAKDSEARLRRLTGDAAHQLRTPLAGIRACAESLLCDPPAEEREVLLSEVVKEASRAARQITGLLRMARLDQGQPVSPVRCDLARLCTDEVERARALAPHLEVDVVVGEVPSTWPECDPHALREILANLLDNSRRHAKGRIEVSVRLAGDHLEVAVSDDGPGVPEGMEEHVFERFVSADDKGGSGLGLPIARGLAQAHGGDLVYRRPAFVLSVPTKSVRDCGGSGRPDFGVDVPRPATSWEDRQAP